MVFTENGLQVFEWDYMAKNGRVIADNTKLLPFEEIRNALPSIYFMEQHRRMQIWSPP